MAKHILIALGAVLGACFGPNAPVGVPCAMNNDCPSGQACDPETRRCEAPDGIEAWLDDTAADFEVDGASADGVAIEREGFIAPVAFYVGGLRLSGIDRHAIPDPLTPWNELAVLPRSGTTFMRGIELGFSGTPPGLGLSGGNDITILVEGEVFLDQEGRWRFQLSANDIGFVEVAPPGSSTFQRIVTVENDATMAGDYDAAVAGWHRIRGAFADGGGEMEYELRYDSPDPGMFKTILPHDLRGPASNVAGVIVDGFEEPFLIQPDGSVIHTGTLGDQTFGSDPFGFPVGNNAYSLRFAAQVLIDVEGDYAFRVTSGQGHRVWLDGVPVADKFGTVPEESLTDPIRLEPGWHDLVIDVHRLDGVEARLDLEVASGPAWVGQTIPLDHLRPVVGRATRWTAAAAQFSSQVPDGGTHQRQLNLEPPRAMVVSRIDAAFQIDHPMLQTMQVRIDPPNATAVTVVAAGTLSGAGIHYGHATLPASTAGTPPGSPWNVLATDTAADTVLGDLDFAAVTLLGSADPPPFPTSSRYVSAPRDLGGAAPIVRVRWAVRQARPDASVTVSMRTCDSAATCEDEAWVPVADGTAPDLPARRFAQYMVELTGAGDVPTALDWIEIRYRPEG